MKISLKMSSVEKHLFWLGLNVLSHELMQDIQVIVIGITSSFYAFTKEPVCVRWVFFF